MTSIQCQYSVDLMSIQCKANPSSTQKPILNQSVPNPLVPQVPIGCQSVPGSIFHPHPKLPIVQSMPIQAQFLSHFKFDNQRQFKPVTVNSTSILQSDTILPPLPTITLSTIQSVPILANPMPIPANPMPIPCHFRGHSRT